MRIALIALAMLVVVSGCKKKPPVVAPPPAPDVVVSAPTTDIDSRPTDAGAGDIEEARPSQSIAELQASLENSGLLGDVFFDFDKADLRANARERLARNAEFMNSAEGRDLSFTVEGHCDERGTNEYNIALGQGRTSSAVDYLASLGIDRSRFKTVSYGEERPFCTQSSEACWQKNRRARFVISGR